jgi:hypothetical protein
MECRRKSQSERGTTNLGGEGVRSLSHIVNSFYVELVLNGMDALILVVCGRNDKLKTSLDTRDWSEVLRAHAHMKTSKSTGALGYCNPISPADDWMR